MKTDVKNIKHGRIHPPSKGNVLIEFHILGTLGDTAFSSEKEWHLHVGDGVIFKHEPYTVESIFLNLDRAVYEIALSHFEDEL